MFKKTKIDQKIALIEVPIQNAKEIEAATFAERHCQALGIADNQEMMMGLAFVVPFELKQFKTLHSIVHIDATMDTNLENHVQRFFWKNVYCPLCLLIK